MTYIILGWEVQIALLYFSICSNMNSTSYMYNEERMIQFCSKPIVYYSRAYCVSSHDLFLSIIHAERHTVYLSQLVRNVGVRV